jgi:hypothetical protein
MLVEHNAHCHNIMSCHTTVRRYVLTHHSLKHNVLHSEVQSLPYFSAIDMLDM